MLKYYKYKRSMQIIHHAVNIQSVGVILLVLVWHHFPQFCHNITTIQLTVLGGWKHSCCCYL